MLLLQIYTKQSELGIGQTSFANYRYKMVSYLPWMYMYEFPFCSKNPRPIVTYDALIYPFDHYIWGFSFAYTFAIFLILATFQRIWAYASREPNPVDWVFQGKDIFEQKNSNFCFGKSVGQLCIT